MSELRNKSSVFAEAIQTLSHIPTIHKTITEGMLIFDDDNDIRSNVGISSHTPCVSIQIYRYGSYLTHRIDMIICDDFIEVYLIDKEKSKLRYDDYWKVDPSVTVIYDILNIIMDFFGNPRIEQLPEAELKLLLIQERLIRNINIPYFGAYPKYSMRFNDDAYEYRIATLTATQYREFKKIGVDKLLTENQWGDLGVVQSPGWEHIMTIKSHVAFRRKI